MKRYHLIIDVEKCGNCNNCFLACKDEHVGNQWPGYAASQQSLGASWMRVVSRERGTYPQIDVAYLPVPCMHCDDGPCMAASNGAVSKRADGVVLIDPIKAKGRKDIVAACPYQAIQWNEEQELPQKCTLCAHLLDKGWDKPRCVQSCPTGALSFRSIEDDEMMRSQKEEGLEPYKPKAGTKPTVLYRNLYRFTTCFIAGSVATTVNGREECVENATVMLSDRAGAVKRTARSDPFGDFRFDNLEPESGTYTIRVESEGHEVGPIDVPLEDSVSMGVIYV